MADPTYTLVIDQGADFAATMTFKRAGVATQVTSPVLEIRDAPDSSGTLLLRLDDTGYITQSVPGVMDLAVPQDDLADLPAGWAHWDMFGTVDGERLKLVRMSRAEIIANISKLDPPAP